MVDKIEMSLDDIIKANRSQKKRGTGARGGLRRNGPQQRTGGRRRSEPVKGGSLRRVIKGRNRGGVQKAKFARGDVNSAWKHDMYDGPKRGGGIAKGSNDVAKLVVSNLDYGVSDGDITELFTEFGPLIKAAVHYDRSGRSLGTADVLFERRSDALKAIKQYNGVPLDGRPMNIQMAVSDVASLSRSSNRLNSSGSNLNVGATSSNPKIRRQGGQQQQQQRRGSASGSRRGGGVGGRTRGGRRGNNPAPPRTADELDAELDAYVNDMKI